MSKLDKLIDRITSLGKEPESDGLTLRFPNGNYQRVGSSPSSRDGFYNSSGERLTHGTHAPDHFAHPVKGLSLEPVREH